MDAENLLQPLIVKAIDSRKWSKEKATSEALKWMASELGVSVDYLILGELELEEQWSAYALMEKQEAIQKWNETKRKKKKTNHNHDKQVSELKLIVSTPTLGKNTYDELVKAWGQKFTDVFFGEAKHSNALISPGQKNEGEMKGMELFQA